MCSMAGTDSPTGDEEEGQQVRTGGEGGGQGGGGLETREFSMRCSLNREKTVAKKHM